MTGKKTKYIACAMAVLSLMQAMPVNAQSVTGTGTKSIALYATVKPSFEISLPSDITLTHSSESDVSQFSGTYEVGIRGTLADNQYVKVVPNKSFTMTGKYSENYPVSVNVSQSKTKWRKTVTDSSTDIAIDRANFTFADGTMSTTIYSKDTYSGLCVFTISLITE